MRVLALERAAAGRGEAGSTPESELLRDEAARVWELYQAGIVREVYFRADRSDAVLLLECEGVAEAAEVLATLPLVARGMIGFEIIPLAPYPGFSRLFASPR